jgi:hypothetical protein
MKRFIASHPNPDDKGLWIGDIRVAAGARIKDEDGNVIGNVVNAWFAEDKKVIMFEGEIEDGILWEPKHGASFSATINGVEL